VPFWGQPGVNMGSTWGQYGDTQGSTRVNLHRPTHNERAGKQKPPRVVEQVWQAPDCALLLEVAQLRIGQSRILIVERARRDLQCQHHEQAGDIDVTGLSTGPSKSSHSTLAEAPSTDDCQSFHTRASQSFHFQFNLSIFEGYIKWGLEQTAQVPAERGNDLTAPPSKPRRKPTWRGCR